MTLAERLYEQGFQRGLEKGILIGGIQAAQTVLQQPEFSREELYEKSKEELNDLLTEYTKQAQESLENGRIKNIS